MDLKIERVSGVPCMTDGESVVMLTEEEAKDLKEKNLAEKVGWLQRNKNMFSERVVEVIEKWYAGAREESKENR